MIAMIHEDSLFQDVRAVIECLLRHPDNNPSSPGYPGYPHYSFHYGTRLTSCQRGKAFVYAFPQSIERGQANSMGYKTEFNFSVGLIHSKADAEEGLFWRFWSRIQQIFSSRTFRQFEFTGKPIVLDENRTIPAPFTLPLLGIQESDIFGMQTTWEADGDTAPAYAIENIVRWSLYFRRSDSRILT